MEWRPNKRQEDFIEIPDDVMIALYGGAAGGGKSDVLVMLPLARRFYEHKLFNGIIFRRTFPELESEIIRRADYWYPHSGAKYIKDLKRWKFPSGALMNFGHIEHESDVKKYDSAEYNYIAFDESTSFTETQIRYLISRLRSKTRELPSICRLATNPGGSSHAWHKKEFVDPNPYGGSILLEKKTGIKKIFIPAKLADNPHLDPNYERNLEYLPEAERRAKKEGSWDLFEGQVFTSWREYRIAGEPEEALHVRELPNIPDWWPRILAVDWGFSAYTYGLWLAIGPDKRAYAYREYAVKKKQVSEWATDIGNLSKNEQFVSVVLCRSAWQDRGEGEKTISQKFTEFSGLIPYMPENSRVLGREMVQEFLRWQPRPARDKDQVGQFDQETANKILRMRGVQAYKDYVDSFEEEQPETNLPKLIVGPQCKLLIETIPACIYDKKDVDGKPAEDVKEFDGDDPYDTLRYAVMEAYRCLNRSEAENNRRAQVGRLVDDLQKTGDQTSYYHRMKRLERTQSTEGAPARRRRYARMGH